MMGYSRDYGLTKRIGRNKTKTSLLASELREGEP